MKVAMMQPAFLPWQGFFELIYQAEVFVILDDFQFSVQSYHQRNRLFTNVGQVGWYTVPISKAGSFGSALNETLIDEILPWRKKMLARLRQNYSKAPFYNDIFPKIEEWLDMPAVSLADLNVTFIKLVLNLLSWERELRFSSECISNAVRSHRVLELLQWCNASQYLAAAGSFGYMVKDGVFPQKNIPVIFQDFEPNCYRQVGSPDKFEPFLSVLDSLFNIGPEETAALIIAGTKKWREWDDMLVIEEKH